MTEKTGILYQEQQRYQPEKWRVPLYMGLAVFVPFLIITIAILITGLSTAGVLLLAAICLLPMSAMFRAIRTMLQFTIITEVHPDGLQISYPPNMREWLVIAPNEIKGHRVCNFEEVIGEYRSAQPPRKNRVFIFKNARHGIHFDLQDGRKIFLATQQSETLTAALNQMMNVSN